MQDTDRLLHPGTPPSPTSIASATLTLSATLHSAVTSSSNDRAQQGESHSHGGHQSRRLTEVGTGKVWPYPGAIFGRGRGVSDSPIIRANPCSSDPIPFPT